MILMFVEHLIGSSGRAAAIRCIVVFEMGGEPMSLCGPLLSSEYIG